MCAGMRLRFTKGINKAVILGMVDTMLANKVGECIEQAWCAGWRR
jgi:hypothetical protein